MDVGDNEKHHRSSPPADSPTSPPSWAADLANRALRNISREYPNHPQHVWEGDADALPPRELHPAFFGCFDWHSAVHTHWLLLRLWQVGADGTPRSAIEAALDAQLTPGKLRVEAHYLAQRPAFERPYGLAWAMLLAADAIGTRWTPPLTPLLDAVRTNVQLWLTGLRHPVRCGTHHQTAFALTLAYDAAEALGDSTLAAGIRHKAQECFAADRNGPLSFEPSGEDFLSPTLMEADLLRRLLPTHEFAAWLTRFLPDIPHGSADDWLPCAEVSDERDGKYVHLNGLNLSRAWNLANIAAALPAGDPRAPALRSAAERHRIAGTRATLATGHYAGDHWLPSFAVYLLTGRSTRGGTSN